MTSTLHRMQDQRLAGGLAVLITVAAVAFANFGGDSENGGAGPYAVSVGLCAIVAAVLFGRVLPETTDPARAAWVLAGLALVSCLVFWSGLPFVLGMAAVYTGARAARSGPILIGGLVVVLASIASVIG